MIEGTYEEHNYKLIYIPGKTFVLFCNWDYFNKLYEKITPYSCVCPHAFVEPLSLHKKYYAIGIIPKGPFGFIYSEFVKSNDNKFELNKEVIGLDTYQVMGYYNDINIEDLYKKCIH